ncbi:hypothetical protein RAMDARK_1045 [Rickettsia amblyommatis str. Darkwater]|nr:hypothetical protein RAMDARK_1045 [Rickettsia amblyommatis str. Darkwater]
MINLSKRDILLNVMPAKAGRCCVVLTFRHCEEKLQILTKQSQEFVIIS